MKWSGWEEFPLCAEVLSADLRKMGEGRAEGLHLGSVIHAMKVGRGENVGDVPGDQPCVRLQEGFLWESALEYMAGGLPLDQAMEMSFKRFMVKVRSGLTKQIALEKDGVHMTPDAFDPAEGLVESYKCTRKSLRRAQTQEDFESNFWPWMVQEKSYCLAAGVDTARWIVLWQAGDYSKGIGSGPRVLQSTAVFTPEELVANWNEVLRFVQLLGGEK